MRVRVPLPVSPRQGSPVPRELLPPHIGRCQSSATSIFQPPPRRRSTLGRRAFSVAGPMAWNAMPDNLRDPSLSADNFRKKLKTHLFRNALGHLRNVLYKFKTYLLTYLRSPTSAAPNYSIYNFWPVDTQYTSPL